MSTDRPITCYGKKCCEFENENWQNSVRYFFTNLGNKIEKEVSFSTNVSLLCQISSGRGAVYFAGQHGEGGGGGGPLADGSGW
jgi:hypothetical protein